MISKELLDILVCPETRAPLKLADDALLDRLRAAIRAGTLRTRAGETFDRSLDGGLVRDDGAVLYPIVDGIPILLMDEAIELASLTG